MGSPLGLQVWVALCAGMVAATLVPAVRRSIPRWLEVALWAALIFVCWLAIADIRQPHARELTAAVNWAAGQIIDTVVGLAAAGIAGILSANRFGIADAMVTIFGADLLALALVSTYRESLGWQPQVRLRDWMELPAAGAPARVAAPVVPSAVDDLNERWAAATAAAGAAAATWSVQFLIWARDVGLPRSEERLALAVAVGRVETRVLLESVQETARELKAAARNRFAGTAPEVNRLALRVAAILNGVAESQQRIAPGAGNLAQVVDIQALRIAQSLSRFGRSASTDQKVDDNDPDQLAS